MYHSDFCVFLWNQGIHGIAFMVSLANKEDLTSISFDEKKLQNHLYHCYKQGRLVIAFPSSKENVKRNTAKLISFELFCSCQMPCAKQNARSVELQTTDSRMWQLYGMVLSKMTKSQVLQRTMQWLCNACQQLRKKIISFFNRKRCQLFNNAFLDSLVMVIA